MGSANVFPRPAQLLLDYWHLFREGPSRGPILDLACGDGHNGIFLAGKGLSVICCDVSGENLSRAKKSAAAKGAKVEFRKVDLEREGINPLRKDSFTGILVFRYLHRPLIPCIKKAIRGGGVLIYETFTIDQPRFGRPRNPDFLLRHGELFEWFRDWEVIQHFEGIKQGPERAIAQVVCRKPPGRL